MIGSTKLAAGEFAGYASLFNVRDASGDIIMPGAFRRSLARRGVKGVRMLFQHDPAQPIGVWRDIREDHRGLYVRGRLSLDVARAGELAGLLRDGAIDGLSIGFRTEIATRPDRAGCRRIHRLDLWEISLVTFPMLTGARVAATKQASGDGLHSSPLGDTDLARQLRRAAAHLQSSTT